jgi:hypothetical protein
MRYSSSTNRPPCEYMNSFVAIVVAARFYSADAKLGRKLPDCDIMGLTDEQATISEATERGLRDMRSQTLQLLCVIDHSISVRET